MNKVGFIIEKKTNENPKKKELLKNESAMLGHNRQKKKTWLPFELHVFKRRWTGKGKAQKNDIRSWIRQRTHVIKIFFYFCCVHV